MPPRFRRGAGKFAARELPAATMMVEAAFLALIAKADSPLPAKRGRHAFPKSREGLVTAHHSAGACGNKMWYTTRRMAPSP